MIPLKLRRKHLRAPLNTNFLFKDELGVQKGIVENISEGGLLLRADQSTFDGSSFSVFFDLPEIANFSNMPIFDIMSLSSENFRHRIFNAEIEAKREVKLDEGKSLIGCEFLRIDDEPQALIKKYVSNYASNIIFTLSLFEQGTHRRDVQDLIKKSLSLLNYPRIEKLSELRQRLLHDYQSLESL